MMRPGMATSVGTSVDTLVVLPSPLMPSMLPPHTSIVPSARIANVDDELWFSTWTTGAPGGSVTCVGNCTAPPGGSPSTFSAWLVFWPHVSTRPSSVARTPTSPYIDASTIFALPTGTGRGMYADSGPVAVYLRPSCWSGEPQDRTLPSSSRNSAIVPVAVILRTWLSPERGVAYGVIPSVVEPSQVT